MKCKAGRRGWGDEERAAGSAALSCLCAEHVRQLEGESPFEGGTIRKHRGGFGGRRRTIWSAAAERKDGGGRRGGDDHGTATGVRRGCGTKRRRRFGLSWATPASGQRPAASSQRSAASSQRSAASSQQPAFPNPQPSTPNPQPSTPEPRNPPEPRNLPRPMAAPRPPRIQSGVAGPALFRRPTRCACRGPLPPHSKWFAGLAPDC
jgi:hypothetical protein